MRARSPLLRGLPALAAGSSLAILLLGAPSALADEANGPFDLPDHALAAGDDVGANLFDRDKHVLLKPKHEKRLEPKVEPARHELPTWPAKWAPPETEGF